MMRIDTRNVPESLTANDRKLAGLIGELGRLETQHAEAFKDRDAANRELDAAPRQDTALYASALRAGKADPGPLAQRAAEEKVANAQRKLDAADIAAGQVTAEICDHVKTALPELLKKSTAAEGKARGDLVSPLERLGRALERLQAARHAAAWAKAVAGSQPRTPTAPDETVLAVNGPGAAWGSTKASRIPWPDVAAAIEDLVDPNRVAARETQRSRSLAPGVPQHITPEELAHGRGVVREDPAILRTR